ncbi:hypothetical protein KEM55_004441 [Ascosphaera atra]|nr:hypothetical protein KEM55_004441 [Ascosphaera atra]
MADSDLPDSISSLSSLPYDALNLPEPQSRSILSHPLLDHLHPTTYSLSSLTAAIDSFLASKDADQTRATTTATLIHSASAALSLFLQINVTGPPPAPALSLNSRLFPSDPASRATITRDLSVDGVAVYSLIPNVELLAFAVAIARSTLLFHDASPAALAVRMRTNVCHQKMLHEVTQTLQDRIYADLRDLLTSTLKDDDEKNETAVALLIESATINILHGFDAHARADLARAAELNRFHFAVTGWLGKRTKFQDRDISQLVVLAKSEGTGEEGTAETAPKHVDLEDDTLLDKISFKKQDAEVATTVQSPDSLPPALSSLDPSNQPPLAPLDSIILLATASAITNTSPQHGLTREETLPYAVRVIESGSKNWQVYSQALLLRSKIEGYRSRTIERGLLQLQALVDQVIADTTEQPMQSFSI